MPDFTSVIAAIRDSVVAIMRIRLLRPAKLKKGKQRPPSYNIAFVGTGFCIVADRLILTAFHIFNEGKPRDPDDRFYAFCVPQNGARAFHREIRGFPWEAPNLDMAILEMAGRGQGVPAMQSSQVSFSPISDGESVMTYGFPAPEIKQATVNERGQWSGGAIFLMSHANEGIISSQYLDNGVHHYELNVGWHHGESGGPIFRVRAPVSAFALMRGYRNVHSPHGIVAGPHLGPSLHAAEAELVRFGASVVT